MSVAVGVLVAIWIVFPTLSLIKIRQSFRILEDQLLRLNTEGARRLMRVMRGRTITMIVVNFLFLIAALPIILFDGTTVTIMANAVLGLLPIIYFLSVLFESAEVKRLVAL